MANIVAENRPFCRYELKFDSGIERLRAEGMLRAEGDGSIPLPGVKLGRAFLLDRNQRNSVLPRVMPVA